MELYYIILKNINYSIKIRLFEVKISKENFI